MCRGLDEIAAPFFDSLVPSREPPDASEGPPGEASLRPLVERVVQQLLTETPPGDLITLDAIAGAVGTARVAYEAVEAIIEALEAEGREVGEPPADLAADLRRVLETARSLHGKLGRTPRIGEIAAESGLSSAAVATALRFSQILA